MMWLRDVALKALGLPGLALRLVELEENVHRVGALVKVERFKRIDEDIRTDVNVADLEARLENLKARLDEFDLTAAER